MGTRRNLTSKLGATGLDFSWGMVNDDLLREWRGTEKAKRVKEMILNSPVIGALRVAIELIIRDVDWQLNSTEGQDDPRIELFEQMLKQLEANGYSWNDHISDALLYPFYGYMLFVVNWERVNGRLLVGELLPLDHQSLRNWYFDERGKWTGVQQWAYIFPDPIPRYRLLNYRFRNNKNNPEGESALRPAWIPYYYTKNLQQLEAITLERGGTGYPSVKAPEHAKMGSGTTDQTNAENLVARVRQDEAAGVVLPFGWEFDFIGNNATQVDFDRVISRYEKRTLMVMLSQMLMLGMDNVGALATFDGGLGLLTKVTNAIADIIADTFEASVLRQLMELNGFDYKGLKLTHSPAGDIDPKETSEVLSRLQGYLSWGEQDEDWLRQLNRMPERESDPVTVEDNTAVRYASVPKFDSKIDPTIKDYFVNIEQLAIQAVDDELTQAEFEQRFSDETNNAILLAFLLAGGGLQNNEAQQAIMEEQRKAAYSIPNISRDIYTGKYDDNKDALIARLTLWANSVGGAYNVGKLFVAGAIIDGITQPVNYEWVYDPRKEHCVDCARLNGVVLSATEWRQMKARGIFPQSNQLECRGFHCGCDLRRTSTPSMGLVNVGV